MAKIQYLIGPPGTGKTFSISKNVARAVDKYGENKVVVCSLTRAAAREAAGRVGLPRDRVGTMHALAYAALDKPQIAELNLKEWNDDNPSYALSLKGGMDYPSEPTDRASVGDEMMSAYQIARARMEDWRDTKPEIENFVKTWESWKADNGYLDFTDLLEQAIEYEPILSGDPKVIFLDEAQDSSKLEMALLRKWAVGADTLVVVGDFLQCIFSWRGSRPQDVFPAHYATHPDVRHLSQSYRLPSSVHAHAVSWISRSPGYEHIDYRPRVDESTGKAVEGRVSFAPHITWKQPDGIVSILEESMERGETSMILVSCGFMLTPLLRELKKQGIPFHNPWRPQNGRWNPVSARRGTTMADRLLSFLKPWKSVWGDKADFWEPRDIVAWAEPMQARGIFVNGGKRSAALLKDNEMRRDEVVGWMREWIEPDALASLPTPGQASAVKAAEWWASKMLSARQDMVAYPMEVLRQRGARALMEDPLVITGTIHSLKGSEADHCFVFPDLSMAGASSWASPSNEAHSEIWRQFYVAMTRARETLTLCGPCGLYAPIGR